MHTLPPLPYAQNALEPHISQRTLEFHYGKHHQGYLNKLNELTQGTPLATQGLEEIMMTTHGDSSKTAIFNNAAQVWNHTFYWSSMAPNGGGQPSGDLLKQITEAFGSFEQFKVTFKEAAVTQFGSGWAWLVLDKSKTLKIVKTGNAENPLTQGLVPLLTCDVWEHAYYLDYQNRRPDYVGIFLESLVNWKFATDNFDKYR
jgi:Fe-Mn family superoxide dismutase